MITFSGHGELLASGTLETGFLLFSGRKIMQEKNKGKKYNHCLVNIRGKQNVFTARKR